jgi:hypothetical protein
MAPVLRISGRGALCITLTGLTAGQAAAIRELITADSGAGFEPAPSHSPVNQKYSSPVSSSEVLLTGAPGRLKRISRAIASHRGLPRVFPMQSTLCLTTICAQIIRLTAEERSSTSAAAHTSWAS